MLQSIRDRATGWVAGFIVVLISIPFALWGVNQYFTGGAETVVAEVAGQEVSYNRFQRAYQQRYQRLQELYGENFDPERIDETALRQQVLEGLIRETLLQDRIRDARFAVSDVRLAKEITDLPAFQENGGFSQETYQRLLAQQGMTVAGFENRFRNALQTDQLRSGIVDTAFVTGRQVADHIRLRDQKREVEYLRVSAETLADSAEVSAEEVQEYYQTHTGRFMTEERVRLAYLTLSETRIRQNVAVSEEKLREMYESEKDQYVAPQERKARHVLIRAEDDQVAARRKAEEIREKALGGADFSELAREHSDDPGSARQGGDLGWISPGTMVEPFEDALYELDEEGQISPVVESQFGFHVIQLTGVRGGEGKSFEEVRDELAERYRERVARERMYDRSEQLANLAFEHPDSLEPAAETLDLSMQTSGWITRQGGDGIGQHQPVVQAAFGDTVLGQRLNSDPIELPDGRVAVIRLADHQPAEQQPLEAVREEIEAQLRGEKARARASEIGRQLLEKAREAGTFTELASASAVDRHEPGQISRRASGAPPKVVSTAFSMAHPGDDGISLQGVQLSNGDYAVVAIRKVIDGDPGALSAEERRNVRRQLAGRQGSMEFDAYMAGLREAADVTIYRDRL